MTTDDVMMRLVHSGRWTSGDDQPATQCASAIAAPGLPSSSLTPLPRQSLLHLVSEYPRCVMVMRFPVFRFPQCSVILNGGVKVCTYPLCTGASVCVAYWPQSRSFLYNNLVSVLHMDPVSVVGKNILDNSNPAPFTH